MKKSLTPIVSEFVTVVDDCYGMYLDGSVGFEKVYIEAVSHQANLFEILKSNNPELATKAYVDSTWFIYGEGDPNDPNNVLWHRTTQGQYRERNAKHGINRKTMSRNCIVAIFEYWDCEFRKRIAGSLGLTVEQVKVPIMGDIRLIRNAILHNRGKYTKECTRTEVIKGFAEGDEIDFETPIMFSLVQAIKASLDLFIVNHGEEDPLFRTILRVK